MGHRSGMVIHLDFFISTPEASDAQPVFRNLLPETIHLSWKAQWVNHLRLNGDII